MFLGTVLGVVALLLAAAALADRRARRRRHRTRGSYEVTVDVMESQRDAKVANMTLGAMNPDLSWTSWSRRNRRG